jgi:RNA polymerase sigma factor (sigma-70 family)
LSEATPVFPNRDGRSGSVIPPTLLQRHPVRQHILLRNEHRKTAFRIFLRPRKIFSPLIRQQEWMDQTLTERWTSSQQDQQISEAVERERARLRNFIRKRVADRSDVEDILQEVFYELVETWRMMKPVEEVTAWLFRVARNRITDLFRGNQRKAAREVSAPRFGPGTELPGVELNWEDLLPAPDAGPDAAYARSVLLQAVDAALEELPEEQREVFIAHEIMGYSFKEIAAQTGVGVNTLLSRKRYAVLHLRERLQAIHDDFTKG